MDRRRFIRTGIGAVGGLMLPWKGGIFGADEPGVAKSKVWIAQGSPAEAARNLSEAIGGLKSLIPPDGVVLLKPNIGFASPPNWGATTDPDFLAAIIDLCVEAGTRRIIVADHPLGSSPEKNLERSGIGAVCEARSSVKVFIADQEKHFRSVDIPQGQVLNTTKAASILDKVDLFINIPTAKHHRATGVSLGLKNLMGLVWDRVPFHEGPDLDQAIADLSTVIRPQLTFLDVRYALLTNGPVGPGQVEEVNKYLAGFDPVAVDSVGVELARWEGRIQKGRNIPHLVKAAKMGVGRVDREDIEVMEV